MSLVEVTDEGQELISVRELFRNFVNSGNYLGALGYYFSLGSKGQNLVKTIVKDQNLPSKILAFPSIVKAH